MLQLIHQPLDGARTHLTGFPGASFAGPCLFLEILQAWCWAVNATTCARVWQEQEPAGRLWLGTLMVSPVPGAGKYPVQLTSPHHPQDQRYKKKKKNQIKSNQGLCPPCCDFLIRTCHMTGKDCRMGPSGLHFSLQPTLIIISVWPLRWLTPQPSGCVKTWWVSVHHSCCFLVNLYVS